MSLDKKEIQDLYAEWLKEFVDPDSWQGPLVSFKEYLLFKFLKSLEKNNA